MFLYTNFDKNNQIAFRDLLPLARIHGSNESEQELTDTTDIADWEKRLEKEAVESVSLLGGKRYYIAFEIAQD